MELKNKMQMNTMRKCIQNKKQALIIKRKWNRVLFLAKFEVVYSLPSGRPRKIWSEVIQRDLKEGKAG